MLTASWIWSAADPHAYNQCLLARRSFSLPSWQAGDAAVIKITADSWYRLFINGRWVADGPARSWPEHYQYDVIDAAPYLQAGQNELSVLVRYWGVGNFHTLPQQAGLLAQLDVEQSSAAPFRLVTDASWQVASPAGWLADTPKVSIQMEPLEMFDARLSDPGITFSGLPEEPAELAFEPAVVLFPAGDGPWRDLTQRDVPLLTRLPVPPVGLPSLVRLQSHDGVHSFTFPAARLAHPGLVEANINTLMPGGLGTLLRLDQVTWLKFSGRGVNLYLDGQEVTGTSRGVLAGDHILLVFVSEVLGHNKEKTFSLESELSDLPLVNPLDAAAENPWVYLAFPEYAFVRDDLQWPSVRMDGQVASGIEAYFADVTRLASQVTSLQSFRLHLSARSRQLPSQEMFVRDSYWRFWGRHVLQPLDLPGADAWQDGQGRIVLQPDSQGDLELCFDFGVQVVGYYELELESAAGVEVDLYAVEYIAPDGVVQHTGDNRNGLTLITRQGVNRFLSTKRRSGRYVFLSLHHQSAPVVLRRFQVVESTHPFEPVATFSCSDPRLDRIWEISARTLKLCMEDTFTDCPLYEQTHWVGDARNEALYSFGVLGALEIARRCIRLTGESLERFPITGCQTPSGWDVLLPAWSFLWTISVWDYYFYSADRAFLERAWSWVVQNLRGAQELCTDQGLFSGPFWNLFDWSGIDDRHDTVLHNSLLLVGALDAARQCAEVLQDAQAASWLEGFRLDLVAAINRCWDPARAAYPDSLLEDGTPSPVSSQHTSFLALLYDVIPSQYTSQALENILQPPDGMVKVGSPFAMQYYYEALEKAGRQDRVLQSIYDSYLPMLELGSTTVWETFPGSDYNPAGFPTRSHCHAWSSAPLYFLPRIILGIQPVQPGGAAYQVSPHLPAGLAWARGTVATIGGPLSVEWRRRDGLLQVQLTAPAGVQVDFIPNASHAGLQAEVTRLES